MLFSEIHDRVARDSRHKLRQEEFRWNAKRNSMLRMVKQWNWWPGGIFQTPPLDVFKTQQVKALRNLV